MAAPWIIFALGALLGLLCLPMGLLALRLGRAAEQVAGELDGLTELAAPSRRTATGSRLLRQQVDGLYRRGTPVGSTANGQALGDR